MKKPIQHRVDTEAQGAFTVALTSEWTRCTLVPDYGVDYLCEVFDGGHSTGMQFLVQLKGKSQARRVGDSFVVNLKRSHIEYYLSLRLPVFVVAADLTQNEVCYVFIQKFALDRLALDNKKQQSFDVHVPRANKVSESGCFRRAVESANSYVAARQAPSAAQVLALKAADLERLDPRFKIEASATLHGEAFHITPKEPVSWTLALKGKGPEFAKRMQDMIERGLTVPLNPGEAHVEGSGLVSTVVSQAGAIQVKRTIPGSVRLVPSGQSNVPLLLEGEYVGGTKELRFTGNALGGLLQLAFTLPDDLATRKWIDFEFEISIDRWAHSKVLELPHFDLINEFFVGMRSATELATTAYANGHRLWSTVTPIGSDHTLVGMSRLVEVIRMARAISELTGQSRAVPETITQDMAREAFAAYEMLVHGRVELTLDEFEITTIVDGLDVGLKTQLNSGAELGASLLLPIADQQFDFLGAPLSVGPAHYDLRAFRVKTWREQLQPDGKTEISATYLASPKSRGWLVRGPMQKPAFPT